MTLCLLSFADYFFSLEDPGFRIANLWVPSKPCFCPSVFRLYILNVKDSLERERPQKIISWCLRSRTGKSQVSCQFVLGLRKDLRSGYVCWNYRVMRRIQEVTQENHIFLATPNSFRSFLGTDSSRNFFFFILEDWLPGPAMMAPIIFHPAGAMNGGSLSEQSACRSD